MNKLVLKVLVAIFMAVLPWSSYANVTGPCSNCHTMHNSQGGQPMATYGTASQNPEDPGSGPKAYMLRGTCFGCHAQITGKRIVTIGSSDIPQVFHQDLSGDLAGGNFAYITGFKGDGPSDAKGHNVFALNNPDDLLDEPPGDQHSTGITGSNLTCAGQYGCHGDRTLEDEYEAMRKAHHKIDFALKFGSVNENLQGTDVGTSYRFLNVVKGGEDDDWQATLGANDHNEYKGAVTPGSSNATSPANDTMSGLCAECHGFYHGSGNDETGGASPWFRHPTDTSLPGAGEYAEYINYDPLAPVARVVIPQTPSGTVDPGGSTDDIVMCLSCHRAHGTPYFKIMRWNYRDWPSVIDPPGSKGCAICHTWKD